MISSSSKKKATKSLVVTLMKKKGRKTRLKKILWKPNPKRTPTKQEATKKLVTPQ
jgi:hypothetical protein